MNDMEITNDDKLWALLAYVFTPFSPLLILLLEDKRDRPFVKAHNVQALIWGLLNVAASTLTFFCPGVLGFIMWIVGVYWGIKAYQGEMVTIPFVTEFVKNQGWA